DALVTCLSGEAVAALAGGEGVTKKAQQEWPQLNATAGRFVVSAVVRTEGLPEPLTAETFLLPPDAPYPDPRRPVVHLQRFDCRVLDPDAAPNESLLVAEAIVPAEGALTLAEARRAVQNTLDFHFPFLHRHLLVVDSPHDGLPFEDYTT